MKMKGLKSLHSGYSLIEVLVATVIIAVGILGIAGLQVISIQQNRSALFRAEATKHATNILDRIRVNNNVAYAPVALATAPAAAPNCGAKGTGNTTCDRDQMKEFDITWWKCSINHLDAAGALIAACGTLGFAVGDDFLPEGKGAIAVTAATIFGDPTDVYEIEIQWKDDSVGNDASITVIAQVN